MRLTQSDLANVEEADHSSTMAGLRDIVERHGHAGDILHYVRYNGKQIGLIVYECKKTQK